MAYFGNARQLLERLQGVIGEPTQISEKLEVVTKIMFGYHGNNKSADFYWDFSENQQFYLGHAKIIYFSFVLLSVVKMFRGTIFS